MAWGSKEKLFLELSELRGEVKALRELNTFKDKEIVDLRAQIARTQEALIAKESPQAYSDQKREEWEQREAIGEGEAQKNRLILEAEKNRELLDHIEAPLFKDAEDLQEMLQGAILKPNESIHENEES